ELICIRSEAEETTTPIFDNSIATHDTRKGDSGGPVFVFDRTTLEPIVIGITAYGGSQYDFFVNLAAQIDFLIGVEGYYDAGKVINSFAVHGRPSFNCNANKLNEAERTICNDIKLTSYDNYMSSAYAIVRSILPEAE